MSLVIGSLYGTRLNMSLFGTSLMTFQTFLFAFTAIFHIRKIILPQAENRLPQAETYLRQAENHLPQAENYLLQVENHLPHVENRFRNTKYDLSRVEKPPASLILSNVYRHLPISPQNRLKEATRHAWPRRRRSM